MSVSTGPQWICSNITLNQKYHFEKTFVTGCHKKSLSITSTINNRFNITMFQCIWSTSHSQVSGTRIKLYSVLLCYTVRKSSFTPKQSTAWWCTYFMGHNRTCCSVPRNWHGTNLVVPKRSPGSYIRIPRQSANSSLILCLTEHRCVFNLKYAVQYYSCDKAGP